MKGRDLCVYGWENDGYIISSQLLAFVYLTLAKLDFERVFSILKNIRESAVWVRFQFGSVCLSTFVPDIVSWLSIISTL